MLGVFGYAELLRFLSSHPVALICIQESNLGSSSSFRIPGFSAMRCGCSHSRSGILSPDAARAGGDVIMFVGRGLSFSELSASSLSSLDPCSDYVGVGISLNGSFSLSFLDVCARLFAPLRQMAGLTPSGTQEVLPTPAERKHWTGSSQLTSSPSMTLTHPPFCIAPLAVTPPLTSPLLPPFLPFIAP